MTPIRSAWLAAGGLALALALCSVAAPPAGELELSADIVRSDASGTVRPAGKLYLAHGVVRIETPAASAGYFLVDARAGTSWFVQPARRLFTVAGQSTPLTQIFIPVDPEAPCGQWQAAALRAGGPGATGAWRCERLAASPRGTLHYRIAAPGQPATERWIEPALRLTVRARLGDGTTFSLEHLRIAPQPAPLFTVPAGYQRLDPEDLIRRLRHSDVWATAPR